IAKYNAADGTLLWVKKIGSIAAEIVSPGALRCDHNGNPYFIGRLSGTGSVDFDPSTATVNVTNSALFLTSFDTTGNLRFANGFNSGTGDGGHRISFDSENNVYMAGWINGTVSFGTGINVTANSTTADAFLAKFTNNGTAQWAFSFGGTGATANNICAGLIVDQEDNAYMTGQLYGTNADVDPSLNTLNLSSIGQNDCFLIKYTKNGLLWQSSPLEIIESIEENQITVFPNPTAAKIIINHNSQINQPIQLEIINDSGVQLYKKKIQANTETIDLSNLAEGIYILKFTNNNKTYSFKKIIKK
ncbi:MAG: T9SS type A sorting domain-containing protein, partial [Bacteroidales bacterium]